MAATKRKMQWRSSYHSTSSKGNNAATAKLIEQQPKGPLRGVYPVLITPFHGDICESIDVTSFRSCISFMKNDIVGCNGVTITGVLGESNRITDTEKELLIQNAAEEIMTPYGQQQQRPFQLCVGVTHTGTSAAVAMCQLAVESGADAVMVSPTKDSSGGPQPSEDDIYYLFEQIAQSCPSTTIVLQDLPSTSGVYLSIDLLVQIISAIPQVQTIKLESLPTINRISALRTNPHLEDVPYSILTGLGALYAGFDMLRIHEKDVGTRCHDDINGSIHNNNTNVTRGSDGFMTGFAFPEILITMNQLVEQKEYDKARRVYEKFLPLIVLEQQPGEGLAVRKEIYRRRGLILSPHVRHPGKNLSPTLRKVLDQQLERSFPRETQVNLNAPIPNETILELAAGPSTTPTSLQ
jgi:4-hydroxy-tetrahydrodipicolinate synthase